MRRSPIIFLTVALTLVGTTGCGNDEEIQIRGPIVLIHDKQRLAVLAEDIRPGIEEGFGFGRSTGTTGGLRMVTYLNFMDPGSVGLRLMVHFIDVPVKTNQVQVDDLASRLMREGMGMTQWQATRDGTESYSVGGNETEFERYTVVAADPEGGRSDMLMYRLSLPNDKRLSIMMITGGVNSFERPKTVERLHDFLESFPSL